MDTNGPIPFRVAAAYGFTPQPRSAPVNQPIAPNDKVAFDAAELLGATVRSDINRGTGFDGDANGANTPHAGGSDRLPLYTRSAEQVEAATRVALGQRIDITG